MTEVTISAKKFLHLFDYIDRIGLNAADIAATVHLVRERIAELDPEQELPAQQYSRFYRALVREMQTLGQPLPWAAGIGSEAFEMMCHCMINGKTLGDALRLASRYDKLLFPVLHYGMALIEGDSGNVRLNYINTIADQGSDFIPKQWDRTIYQTTVSSASGLLVWQGMCGWLTGQPLDVSSVNIAAPYLNLEYEESLKKSFNCPVHFESDDNTFSFSADQLSRRIVQTPDSLEEFFNNIVYQLILSLKEPASTSAAIKSLVSIDIPRGMPSFSAIAESLHMSESSLRRRLKQEDTSYQILKDEVRCDIAINKLLNEDNKVAEIADYLGFSESSSFVRSFKGWTGSTPKAYKERMLLLGES